MDGVRSDGTVSSYFNDVSAAGPGLLDSAWSHAKNFGYSANNWIDNNPVWAKRIGMGIGVVGLLAAGWPLMNTICSSLNLDKGIAAYTIQPLLFVAGIAAAFLAADGLSNLLANKDADGRVMRETAEKEESARDKVAKAARDKADQLSSQSHFNVATGADQKVTESAPRVHDKPKNDKVDIVERSHRGFADNLKHPFG